MDRNKTLSRDTKYKRLKYRDVTEEKLKQSKNLSRVHGMTYIHYITNIFCYSELKNNIRYLSRRKSFKCFKKVKKVISMLQLRVKFSFKVSFLLPSFPLVALHNKWRVKTISTQLVWHVFSHRQNTYICRAIWIFE